MIHLIKHIHWRYSIRTKILIIGVLLYTIAGVTSAFDFSGKTSNVFCSLLTLGISIACGALVIKAYRLAKKIEYSPNWLCTCCCRDSAKLVLLGYMFMMGTLGVLKLWSITDLFIDHWAELPISYHAQAWAYLASNATSIIMAYVIINVFEAKYDCAQKERTFTIGVLNDS